MGNCQISSGSAPFWSVRLASQCGRRKRLCSGQAGTPQRHSYANAETVFLAVSTADTMVRFCVVVCFDESKRRKHSSGTPSQSKEEIIIRSLYVVRYKLIDYICTPEVNNLILHDK